MDAAQLWDYLQSLKIVLPDGRSAIQLVAGAELPGPLSPEAFSLEGEPIADAIATQIRTLNHTPQYPNGMGGLSHSILQILLTGRNVGNTGYVARSLTTHLAAQPNLRVSLREISTMPSAWAIEVTAWGG